MAFTSNRIEVADALEFAVFPWAAAEWGSAASEEELKLRAESVVAQIRRILAGVE